MLRDEYQFENADQFIQQAEQHGIDALLGNPISLELLVKAMRQQGSQSWPAGRYDVLDLACRELVTESNRDHRDRLRDFPIPPESLLDSAGELSALILLADIQGLATDQDAGSDLYPTVADLRLGNSSAAAQSLSTRLFSVAAPERMRPVHRTVAEFLGARWINRQLADKRLMPHRLLSQLLAPDGGLVAELRGLTAWLAALNADLCQKLTDADPVAVALYGDIQLLPAASQRYLLRALFNKARGLPQLHWQLAQSPTSGDLATAELLEDFQGLLTGYRHAEASQAELSIALTIFMHRPKALPELKGNLLNIVQDARCWQINRIRALESWLGQCAPDEVSGLLQAVGTGQVQDADDELLGHLLEFVYPNHLRTLDLLDYFHPLKQRNLLGTYWGFWRLSLWDKLPEADMPALLDQLVKRPELFEGEDQLSAARDLADRLLVTTLQFHGDQIDDDRLFQWLGVGIDQYGLLRRDREMHNQIRDWLSARPERVKAMVRRVVEKDGAEERHRWLMDQGRLHDARHPNDMADWLLSVAASADESVAVACVNYLAQGINAGHNPITLTLDQVLTWQQNHPDRAHLLKPLLVCNLPSLQTQQAEWQVRENDRRQELRSKRTQAVRPLIPAIRDGTAEAHVYDQLAKLWHGRFYDTPGDTPQERFQSYCDVGDVLFEATQTGFVTCVREVELPTAQKIIDLRANDQRHRLDLAVLTGAQILLETNRDDFDALPDQRLASLVAFDLVDGGEGRHDWWAHCLSSRPQLTASVYIDYAITLLKAGKDYLSGSYALYHDDQYRALALYALPDLLRRFPLRARRHQLNHLTHFIRAAQKLVPDDLRTIAAEKLSKKSLLASQKAYWLVAALGADPEGYEETLLQELKHSTQRLRTTADVLEKVATEDTLHTFSPQLTGQLIELLIPQQSLELESGWVTLEHRLGDFSRALISRLSSDPDPACTQEIERLLQLELPDTLKFSLASARESQVLARRDHEYRFLDIHQVSKVLHNQSPQSAKDLQHLVLDVLQQIAEDLRSSRADIFKHFWDRPSKSDRTPRLENECRDTLISLLKDKLDSFDIRVDPESDHRNDKRSDIQLSYRNSLSLPVEVKLESSDDLWTAMHQQLMAQYTITPESGGRGLFVVFWFNKTPTRPPPGGLPKPKSAAELKRMLEKLLNRTEADLIKVIVLDASWSN
ncbi:hypothetical protein E4656_11850 [Natronospirillum operosum]|uniref:Uncharacterized protein n=1 Tax=Natronospirillum operosum TaxID=2759953 RepID=A0A4Z0W6G3_9GAMM|nr:hypothetical protein E4656_11850 [Natronospirillum operosum]